MEWLDIAYKIFLLVAAVGGAIFGLFKWLMKQDKQDDEISILEQKEKEDVKALKNMHESDMTCVNEELTIMTYGILACLKGLKEQGCNGPVTKAINDIEKHLNKKAHK